MQIVSPLTIFREGFDGMSMEALGAMFDEPFDKSTILRWERNGVPMDRVLEVESVTGIPREVLRPDFYRTAEKQGAAA